MKAKQLTNSPRDIERTRNAFGLSTDQAAELIGVTRRFWQQIEAGTATLRPALFDLFIMRASDPSAVSSLRVAAERHMTRLEAKNRAAKG